MFTINSSFFEEAINDACFVFGYESLSVDDDSFSVALRVKEPEDYYSIDVNCNYKKLFEGYCIDKKIDLTSLDSLNLKESEALELFYMHIALHLKSILIKKLEGFIYEKEQEIKSSNDTIEIQSFKECIKDYNYSIYYLKNLKF